MDILSKLKTASISTTTLEDFIDNNITDFYELLLYSKFEELNLYREDIDNFVLENLRVLSKLDLKKPNNESFINILLEVAERFSFGLSFSRLYAMLEKNKVVISARIEATNIYNLKIRTSEDLETVFDKFFEKLLAATDEDDNHDKIIAIAINFYAKIVYDFGLYNLPAVEQIKSKIFELVKSPEYSIFDNDLIRKVLNLEILDHELVFNEIQGLLDGYLTRVKSIPKLSLSDYLIEIDTDYAEKLTAALLKFENIRQISVNSYNSLDEPKDSVFKSLGRGVSILDEEKQLFAYMNSYSNMHYEKLNFAFRLLPNDLYDSEINIIDWGCGQGMASLSFLDFLLHEKERDPFIKSITLIEPSEIALRRAALHVLKYKPEISLKTINKDFDSLASKDVTNLNSGVKLHIFSNVLDMDQFSLTSLIQLMKTIGGQNYCICVSPYITALKTNRLNVFRDSFSSLKDYQNISSLEKKSGDWIKGWSKVIRIFKYEN